MSLRLGNPQKSFKTFKDFHGGWEKVPVFHSITSKLHLALGSYKGLNSAEIPSTLLLNQCTVHWWKMRWILSGGLVLRLGLYVLSVYQDATPLKFTDIDYSVFSDAAAQVALKGASPYSRSTYRYTPLLAYLNIPNLYIHSSFGKWVFGLADLMTGYLLNALLKDFGVSALWRQGLSAFWVLNPFVAIISMRGSAESILGLLILLNVYFHLKKRYTLSALVYGLSVHFKVFPIIYALPLWLSISSSSALASSKSSPGVRTRSTTRKEYRDPFFSRERIRFGLISGCTFLALNAIFYHL